MTTADGRADALARALMTAASDAAALSALWPQADVLPDCELAWALKRACDAAWTTEPPATLKAAALLEQLALRRPSAAVAALAAWARGIALLAQGQMEEALAALVQAGDRFAARQQPYEQAQTQVACVMALAMLGRFDEAIACGARARAQFDAAGDSRAAGKVELNLGNIAARRDLQAQAIGHYTQALTRFAAAADIELETMATKGLADMHARRHEFETAEALYRKARASAEAGGFVVVTASIDRDLGGLEMSRGRYDLALRHLERSCRGYAGLGVPHYLAVAEESLGDVYLELNLLPEALALYERSLATYEAAGLATDRAWALSQRGRALTLLGRHDRAAASLAQAQAAFANDGNDTGAALVRLWLAELALQRREWAAAADHAAAAEAPLRAARQMGWVLHAVALRAEALRGAGDAQQAEAVARALRERADEMMLPPAQRRSRELLGLLARDRGDAIEARRCFEAVVESIESQRGTLPREEFRAAFLGDNLLPYRELVRLELDDAGPRAAEGALHWVERARARSLADSIDGSDDARSDSADPATREVARLRLALNHCYRSLARPSDDGRDDAAQLLERARGIEQRLLEASRRSVLGTPAAMTTGAVLDLAALHAALGDHSALVEYFSLDDALLACVVADGRVGVTRLPASVDQVHALIEQLRFQTDTLRHGAARMAHRLPELQQRALHHLQRAHAALWAPLATQLGTRRAVVVPHGALHYLPFEALHDGRRHEVERRELCRAPSAAVLLRCLARPRRRFDSALVLGHADARLPHVQREIDAVAARFAVAHVLRDGDAGSAALRAPGRHYDVTHIACHAQFRNDSPRFSALHLADGAFTVRDAAGLRLASALVTLSACETGISAVMPGDELIGLTHAFLSAGAGRVLASLWTVQDEAAAGFMQRFYERLRSEREPARALRATQVETLGLLPHPYFWSAFTLHGGW